MIGSGIRLRNVPLVLLADAEEFGREVIPLVREGVARREAEGRPRGIGTLTAA